MFSPSLSQGPQRYQGSHRACPSLLCSPSFPFSATHVSFLPSSRPPPCCPGSQGTRACRAWGALALENGLTSLSCAVDTGHLGPKRTLYPLLFGAGTSHCLDQDLEWNEHLTDPCPLPTVDQRGVSAGPTGQSEPSSGSFQLESTERGQFVPRWGLTGAPELAEPGSSYVRVEESGCRRCGSLPPTGIERLRPRRKVQRDPHSGGGGGWTDIS